MSDFDDDFDAQLLELAGATDKKKKRRQSGGGGGAGDGGERAKKRRTSHESHSQSGESERESEDDGHNNNGDQYDYRDPHEDPFPLEGKYIDEADRQELLMMTELKREQILEERAEQKQRIQNAKALADMVRQQQKLGGSGGPGPSGAGANGGMMDEDSVSRAAKRQHAPRGATKEKTKSLDVLKAKRKAKDDNKRVKAQSPSRERSTSPQDMDISDSDSEDGQITKTEQEDERLLNLSNGAYDSSRKKDRKGTESEVEGEGGNATALLTDLESCRLSRDAISKHCHKPWFQDYVTGSWVRYLIGAEPNGAPVYRICEVQNLAADLAKPYKVNDQIVNQAFELKHGNSVRVFNMDKVSNAPFTEREYDRLVRTCEAEKVVMPTKRTLETKRGQMMKLLAQPMTDADITQMLKAKAAVSASLRGQQGLTALERSRLNQERTLAMRRGEYDVAAEVEARLNEDAALQAANSANGADSGTRDSRTSDAAELLAKVNARNRKANMEAVQKAEQAEAQRKKRERERRAQEKKARREKSVEEKIAAEVAAQMFQPLASSGTGGAKRSFQAAALENYEIDLGDF